MRKILFFTLVIFLLLAELSYGAGVKLTPVDYLPMRVLDQDGTNLYGIMYAGTHPNARLARTTGRTVLPTQVYDFDPTSTNDPSISAVWCPTPGQVFVVVTSNSTNESILYKSIDSGSHFGSNSPTFDDGNPVFRYGDVGGGSYISGVASLLNRSFLNDTVHGQYLLGEYNVNGSRTPGSTNDQVRLMKSTDQGTTWAEVAHWNTDGSNTNIRHIHAIRQDPYDPSGKIYICTGDLANGGIFTWDGVGALASNQNVVDYTPHIATAEVGERAEACDLLFTADYVIYGADAETAGEQGIWRFAKDLSGLTRINSDLEAYPHHSHYLGLKGSDGTWIWSDFGETGVASPYLLGTLTTSFDGATWGISGQYTTPAASSTGGGFCLLEFKGEFYYARSGAGKNNYFHTAVFKSANATFTETSPDIISPVFWAAAGGTDAAPATDSFTAWGSRPGYPFATPGYAMTSSRMTWGSRLLIDAQDFERTTYLSPSWSANAKPGDSALKVVIEGQGRNSTKIHLSAGSADSYTLYCANEQTPVLFKKLSLYSLKAATTLVSALANATALKDKIYFEDCTIGDGLSTGTGIRNAESVVLTRTRVQIGGTTNNVVTMASGGVTTTKNTEMYGSDLFGGKDSYYEGIATTLTAYHTDFRDFSQYGVEQNYTIPTMKNCAFKGAAGYTYDMYDAGTAVEDDAHVDYNCYTKTCGRFANNGGSHSKINSDPLFASSTDIRIGAASPALKAGTTGLGVVLDYNDLPIPLGPFINMGASNNQYLEDGMGLGLSTSGGNFNPAMRMH